jgi:hypothetical protein
MRFSHFHRFEHGDGIFNDGAFYMYNKNQNYLQTKLYSKTTCFIISIIYICYPIRKQRSYLRYYIGCYNTDYSGYPVPTCLVISCTNR